MKNICKLMSLVAALFMVACNTPEEPEKPTPTPTPNNPDAVTMTDIEITDVLDIAAYFNVTVTKMDDFGFMVIKAEEYKAEDVTVDYVITNSGDFMYEDYARGNYSWEEPMPIPFEEDLEDETDYIVVAAAKNSTSEVLKSAEFTTQKTEMEVEKRTFSPTKIVIESNGTNHVMTMSSALHELRVTLTGREEFGGRYDNNYTCNCEDPNCTPTEGCTCEDCQSVECVQGFIAEGAYLKWGNSDGTDSVYDTIDTTIGNIDFYENVVTGKWEVYGSFSFAKDEIGFSWLTIEIEIPTGITITNKERTEPYEFLFPLTNEKGEIIPLSAQAEKSADNANVWNLTVANNKDNTLTFTLDLGEDLEYIPSDTYNYGETMTACSMVVNNVLTSPAKSETYASKVVIDYNAETEESYISVDVMVRAGTAVVKVNNAGPFKLYEEVSTEAEIFTEGESVNSMAVWATWDESGCWWLECFGLKFNMNLYFMTGTDASEHLPAGRYYLRSTAPTDGSLWVDASRSYAQAIRTKDQLPFVCDTEDAYIDVTAEWDAEAEYWRHTMVGTLKTTNGAYIINLNFVKENASIY